MNFATSLHTTGKWIRKGLRKVRIIVLSRLETWAPHHEVSFMFLDWIVWLYTYWRGLTEMSIFRVKAMRRPMARRWTETGTYAFFIYKHSDSKKEIPGEGASRANKKTMINIGECIKEEIIEQDRSISWLAKKLNRNRTAIYRMLSKNSIDTHLLFSISMLLHRDFFAEFSSEIKERFDQKSV